MAWIPWTDKLKKLACRYLLERYLGHFLVEQLTLDQLTINLYNGTGGVTNVSLDVQALNEMGEQYNLPLEFVDGHVEAMTVSIPWTTLLKEESYIEVTGLRLTVQPRQRTETGTSMFESMWSSTSSSMQIAQEYLQQDAKSSGKSQPLEGIERFAQTIDSILCRVKIRFHNTVIRLEHVPLDSAVGVAMEIRINNLEYSDEAGADPSDTSADPNQASKGYIASAFCTKRFKLEGVTFHLDEFPSKARTFSRNLLANSRASTPDSKNSDGQFSLAQSMPTPPEKNSTLNNSNGLNDPIMFAKLSGNQEIRLKLKQGDGVAGPKVELDVSLGSLTLFLTPRHVHALLDLMEGLASPDMEDTSNVAPKQHYNEKPMATSDYGRVEQELIKQINPLQGLKTMDMRNTHGWSAASLDDSDEDEFLPMRLPGVTSMNNSMTSNNFSMEGSFTASSISSKSSVANSATRMPKAHRHGSSSSNDDQSTETSQFHLALSSIAMVLLHEDILLPDFKGYGLTKASAMEMKATAEKFFQKIGYITTSGYGNKDFENTSDLLTEACPLNHLRLLAAPLAIEASEKKAGKRSSQSGELTVATLEVVECLFESVNSQGIVDPVPTIIPLLNFVRETASDGTSFSNRTDFQVKFSHTEKAVRRGRTTKYCHPRTEFDVTLGSCEGELDISIVDRISSLLNRTPVCNPVATANSTTTGLRNSMSQQSLFYQAVECPSPPDSRTEIKVSASKCLIKLRFPIPDLRPAHDIDRTAWWRRSVRKDYVSLNLLDAKVRIQLDSQARYLSRNELQCRQVILTYTEADSDIALEIAKASADEGNAEGFGWPRIVLTIYPSQLGQGPLEDSSEGELEVESCLAAALAPPTDDEPSFEQPRRQNATPFSSKRVIHESDTPHPKHSSESTMPPPRSQSRKPEAKDSEELVIPGNRQEMTDFIEEATRSARIQLELGLPCLSVQIPSKHLYELIYNRFNTDLLLWQSSAPKPKCPATAASRRFAAAAATATAEPNIAGCDLLLQESSIYPKFSMCKSAIQYDSDSCTDEDNNFGTDAQRQGMCETLFYSATSNVSGLKGKKRRSELLRNQRRQKQQQQQQHKQSKVAVSLNIGQGLLTMYTPVRDSEHKVIPGQQGEVVLRVEDAHVFSVSEYKSDENLSYVCAMSKEMALYHCGSMTAVSTQPPPLRSIKSIIPNHCLRTIYRTEATAQVGADFPKDMFSVAISIQTSHQTHRIKTFKVALGFNQASLNHRVTSSQTSWFSQLSDCLDVIDHPVVGYTPPGVLTELHVHLWDCAIDYRPLHLPLKSFVNLGNFSISSNMAAQTNTSTLRFIAEDVGLFISDKTEIHSSLKVNLERDYVCVMDLGLFELSIRLNERQCGGAPLFDLRASNNILHIRTCSDSGRALMQLLTYYAGDGDLDPRYREHSLSPEADDFPISEQQQHHLSHHLQQHLGETLLGDEGISHLTKSQIDRVNILMEEAMEEAFNSAIPENHKKCPQKNKQQQQVEVFFFPDEQSKVDKAGVTGSSGRLEKNLQQKYRHEEPVAAATTSASDDTDDDFCILGEEAGVGIIPAHGEPEIRFLSHENVTIVENHFAVPQNKRDLLKPPKRCPNPIRRYRLREATIVWHIYGGKDFGENHRQQPTAKARHGVNFESDQDKRKKTGASRSASESWTKNSKNSWREHGGATRRQDVLMELQLNKVRFLHEIYPDSSADASFQGLEVNEIEVRDRLASSEINKFMYQYSSEAVPKQSHANMLYIKAIHTRPDPRLPAQECCLKISLLPVRLNIDQDSLLFLIEFFNELVSGQHTGATSESGQQQPSMPPTQNRKASQCEGPSSANGSRQGTPTHQPPIMTVDYDANDADGDHAGSRTGTRGKKKETAPNSERNLMLLFEDELVIKESVTSTKVVRENHETDQPIYFRSVTFAPDVLVRLDYHGKRVDLTHGPLAGLLMGLAQLNCSELKLKRLAHRQGLLGFDKLVAFLLQEWTQDIKKNQLPSLLGGVGPMYSLLQLFQGVRDLFWMPIEQYQKDGRIVRGLQRGANSFTTSTAMAALELTSRLIYAIQTTAETAYDMVSPGPSVRSIASKGHRGRRKRYSQPLDIREGVTNAYVLVKEGLGETASQLVRVASEEHEQKGVSGAVGGVLRQIPPTVVKPIILATEATNNVLGGMRSQLVPDARHEAVQKWRSNLKD